MVAIPKDKPIIDRALMMALKIIIAECEWPNCRSRWHLDVAHIRARGMGGGRRKDVPDNLIILCRKHHEFYDHTLGQSRANQAALRKLAEARPRAIMEAVQRYLAVRHECDLAPGMPNR